MGKTGREDAGSPCWFTGRRPRRQRSSGRDAPEEQEEQSKTRGRREEVKELTVRGREGWGRDEAHIQTMQDA